MAGAETHGSHGSHGRLGRYEGHEPVQKLMFSGNPPLECAQ